jgi:hypothetical protein
MDLQLRCFLSLALFVFAVYSLALLSGSETALGLRCLTFWRSSWQAFLRGFHEDRGPVATFWLDQLLPAVLLLGLAYVLLS